MIPTHQSDKTVRKEVIVNRLAKLNEYDFGEPHRHAYFEFFYFKKGGGVHRIDFQDFPIGDHSIHVVAPGQVHQVERSLDSNGFVCLFELDALSAMKEINAFLFNHVCFDVASIPPVYSFQPDPTSFTTSLSGQIEQLIDSDGPHRQLMIRAALHGLCLACMDLRGDQNLEMEGGIYAEFRRALFQHFRSLKKVQDYADLLCISEKSLNEHVRKHVGKNASEVIYDQIILEAKRLLLTGLSAKETAYDLNFDDPGHFSKFFKNKVGIAPSAFRNVHD